LASDEHEWQALELAQHQRALLEGQRLTSQRRRKRGIAAWSMRA
jgi:hypothetical protein